MNGFTRREAVGALLSPDSRTKTFTRKVKLDSKGRILIPAEIKRNFGLEAGSDIKAVFSLDSNLVLLVLGRDGVADSMGDCGFPGPGSTAPFWTGKRPKARSGNYAGAENPGPDPSKTKNEGE